MLGPCLLCWADQTYHLETRNYFWKGNDHWRQSNYRTTMLTHSSTTNLLYKKIISPKGCTRRAFSWTSSCFGALAIPEANKVCEWSVRVHSKNSVADALLANGACPISGNLHHPLPTFHQLFSDLKSWITVMSQYSHFEVTFQIENKSTTQEIFKENRAHTWRLSLLRKFLMTEPLRWASLDLHSRGSRNVINFCTSQIVSFWLALLPPCWELSLGNPRKNENLLIFIKKFTYRKVFFSHKA